MPRVSAGTRVNRKLKPASLPAKFAPGFLGELDGRTELARALKQRFEAIVSDLGGEAELSNLKTSLAERAVFLEAMLVKIESDLATANDPKAVAEILSRWIQAVNSFTGIAKTLGLERKLRDPWASVLTPPAPAAQPSEENSNDDRV
jgi:hypothetical protein